MLTLSRPWTVAREAVRRNMSMQAVASVIGPPQGRGGAAGAGAPSTWLYFSPALLDSTGRAVGRWMFSVGLRGGRVTATNTCLIPFRRS